MAETPTHPPGTFCWAELGSSDQRSARGFYTDLFGWDVEEVDMGQESTYTMFHMGGRYTAALYQVDRDLPNAAPDCWNAYVSVRDADASAAHATELGGSVLAGPFDVPGAGRMAVVRDPTGAVVSLWQAGGSAGVGVKSEHGALCWNELLTNDTGAAGEFYEKLFGWTAHAQEMPPPTGRYVSFLLGDFPVGGMMAIRPEWGEMSPFWATYFAVDDCDGTVDRARELGGRVVAPPMDIPQVGRLAWLADPLGAPFSVIALAER